MSSQGALLLLLHPLHPLHRIVREWDQGHRTSWAARECLHEHQRFQIRGGGAGTGPD
jgi:hypothetical protein